MGKEFVAHVRERDGLVQPLSDHLRKVAVLCGQFSNKIGLKYAGRVIGLLHDFGKACHDFDKYIRSETGMIDPDADEYADVSEQKGKIDHSTAGAQIIYRNLAKKSSEAKLVAQILSLCVASHHSGLIDCLTPEGKDNYTRRMEKDAAITHVDEALSYLCENDRNSLNRLLSNDLLIKQVIDKLHHTREEIDDHETLMFKFGLLIRFLLSCLIDADRLNTADFEHPSNRILRNYGRYRSWQELMERLNQALKEIEEDDSKTEINCLRQEVSRSCEKFGTQPKGIYRLTVPTGGGKTLSSLRFALMHAAHHNLDRIFYVIPFTSIIDQNAAEVRRILEDTDEQGNYLYRVVLEHHSNFTPFTEIRRQNLLAENWDAPIVFTTQVQFFEALFGSGTRSVRRMHQLANSVIIFDEIQTIPIRCVHLFNVALRFLVKSCGSTAVLCTATQPLLDKVEPLSKALQINTQGQMIPDVRNLFRRLNRVTIIDKRKVGGWTNEDIAELAQKETTDSGSTLIVVNTKKSAQSLYKLLSKYEHAKAFHLSTNMCPAHRMDVLGEIHHRLHRKPTICVSTQLIEAGINIDFGSVIRFLAGMDSIAQAAGRCNRHGKRPFGNVYIVNSNQEDLSKLPDIRKAKDAAERVLDEFKANPEAFDNDIQSPAAMDRYYYYYFYVRKNIMNYPVSDKTIVGRADNLFALLSTNPKSIEEYKRINDCVPQIPLKQSFQTAAKVFQAIDSPTRGIVVPYGEEGKELINQLCSVDIPKEPGKWFKLLKIAQRFSVNVYPNTLTNLEQQKAVHEVQEGTGILYLDAQFYSNEIGLSEEIVNEMEIMTF